MRHSMGGSINGQPVVTAPVLVRKPEPPAEEPKVSSDKAPAADKKKEK